MYLNYWGECCKDTHVIFTGTAHAKYGREYMKNGQYEFWAIYVGPLQSNVFDILLQLHPVLQKQGIKEEVLILEERALVLLMSFRLWSSGRPAATARRRQPRPLHWKPYRVAATPATMMGPFSVI